MAPQFQARNERELRLHEWSRDDLLGTVRRAVVRLAMYCRLRVCQVAQKELLWLQYATFGPLVQ